jgi:ABC-type lipoprotein export system ATPase subunit
VSSPADTEPTLRLRLQGVEVDFDGHRVLGPVELCLEEGSPVALTGPSGSGKTMLCLVVAGALAPTRGHVVIDEASGRTRRTSVGLVLQGHGLVARLTAAENVALPLQARKLEPDERARRTEAALARVGLAEAGGRIVDGLSGGERQRVGIARAIAGDPDILVADEPSSELDPTNRERVLEALLGGPERRIVVVASDDADVLSHFSCVVHLEQGRIQG